MNDNHNQTYFLWFDLAFFLILAAISEYLSHMLLETWSSGFYFSFSTALCLIAMIRWGLVGVFVGLAGGIPAILHSGMPLWSGILYHVLVNVFLAFPMLLYGNRNRNKIAGSPLFLSVYIILTHCCLCVGKGLLIGLLTGEGTGIRDYFGANLFPLVMNLILCLVLRTREGLVCDMRYYFLKERGEGNGENGY